MKTLNAPSASRWEEGETISEGDGPPGPMRLLLVSEGFARTFALPDRGKLLIGRGKTCDIRVLDPAVSRKHAEIEVGESMCLRDLRSKNGTRLGRDVVTPDLPVSLSRGDVIEIGGAMMIIQSRGPLARPRRLLSHEYFETRLKDECLRCLRGGKEFALLRVRLEGSVDERDGIEHLVADLRPVDLIGIYAPGEWEVLLIGASSAESRRVARRLEERVRELGVVIRTGVAHCPSDGHIPETLMARVGERVNEAAADEERAPTILASPVMKDLDRMLGRVAGGHLHVLLQGETGVGKEIFAERLHQLSPRGGGPILRLNCAAISPSLLESELFGHERGAFTGAERTKPGLLESARGGTVFLDEIGDLSLELQAKLLRVLEEGCVRRVGGLTPCLLDVRFVTATHRDLEQEVARFAFRQDLFFRLNGITLVIPPLRERREDIEPLAQMFLKRFCQSGKIPPAIAPEALALLRDYDWPGNIRELRNVIERAVLLCGTEIQPEHLPIERMRQRTSLSGPSAGQEPLDKRSAAVPAAPSPDLDADLPDDDLRSDLERRECEQITRALRETGGNQTRAASLLSISRRKLITRLERYGLPRPRKSSRKSKTG